MAIYSLFPGYMRLPTYPSQGPTQVGAAGPFPTPKCSLWSLVDPPGPGSPGWCAWSSGTVAPGGCGVSRAPPGLRAPQGLRPLRGFGPPGASGPPGSRGLRAPPGLRYVLAGRGGRWAAPTTSPSRSRSCFVLAETAPFPKGTGTPSPSARRSVCATIIAAFALRAMLGLCAAARSMVLGPPCAAIGRCAVSARRAALGRCAAAQLMLLGVLCAAIGRCAALGDSCGFNGAATRRRLCRFGVDAGSVSRWHVSGAVWHAGPWFSRQFALVYK